MNAPMNERMDRLALFAIVALVALSPWPLGSRLPWAGLTAAAVALAVTALWLVHALLTDRPLRTHAALLPALGFLAWTGIQWLAGWTVYAHGTAVGWTIRAAYLAIFFLVLQLAAAPAGRRVLQRTVIYTGLAVAAFGLIQFLTWNGLLYWFYEPPYEGTRFGPFNNRNYFAGYLAAALPAALALGLLDRRAPGRGVILYCAWLGALAGLMSLSRGGAVALFVAVGLTLVVSARFRAEGRGAWLRVGAVIAVLLLVGLIGLQQADRVIARLETVLVFQEESSFQGRVSIWSDTLSMASERPIAGWGLDTFGWAFANFRTAPRSSVAMHAHDEYLEVLAETGLIGAALALAFLVLLMRSGVARLRAATRGSEQALRLGAVAGWTATLVYSLTDFPTIIPAISIVLAVLAGLMLAEHDSE